MNVLNKEELRRQIREGKEVSIDCILDEFKSFFRESLRKLMVTSDTKMLR